jgi:DNA-binding LacI/PurR family transcriptional regulator
MSGIYIFSAEIDRLSNEIFDGIITTSMEESDLEVLRAITSTPIIMARYCKHGNEFHIAGWNHRAEGALVAEHFISRGHQRIAMLHRRPEDTLGLEHRWEGFVRKAAEMGVKHGENQCHIIETRRRLAPMLKKLIGDGVDGVWMPGHQYYAAEGLKILQEVIGVQVPKDISVIGSENSGVSLLLQPSLTTVAAPFRELADCIVGHLIGLIESKSEGDDPETALLKPFLIERDSVANRLDMA